MFDPIMFTPAVDPNPILTGECYKLLSEWLGSNPVDSSGNPITAVGHNIRIATNPSFDAVPGARVEYPDSCILKIERPMPMISQKGRLSWISRDDIFMDYLVPYREIVYHLTYCDMHPRIEQSGKRVLTDVKGRNARLIHTSDVSVLIDMDTPPSSIIDELGREDPDPRAAEGLLNVYVNRPTGSAHEKLALGSKVEAINSSIVGGFCGFRDLQNLAFLPGPLTLEQLVG